MPKEKKMPAQSGTIVLDQPSPSLGDTVTFTTTTSGLKGNQTPRIYLAAFQALDGDMVVDDLVFGMSRDATEGFKLGADTSAWLSNGGPAHCVAQLYYWDWHPVQTFVPLATVEFDAAG